ncbi:hypothetical protein [Mesorhizobium mediterraneum]|uniref:NmrA family NAD(P)-binding protein n=1 Tax=Mesorhizobium mediterraneum TaxID=43617 RepID=UPI0032B74338
MQAIPAVQASITAHALIELRKPVRVVLRRLEQAEKWTKLGVNVAIANIEDVPSLATALRDAAGAFLISPPPVSGDPYRRADEVGSALAEAVREAGLPKVVALSSVEMMGVRLCMTASCVGFNHSGYASGPHSAPAAGKKQVKRRQAEPRANRPLHAATQVDRQPPASALDSARQAPALKPIAGVRVVRTRILRPNDQHARAGTGTRRAHCFGIAVLDPEQFVTDLSPNYRKTADEANIGRSSEVRFRAGS